MSLQQRSANQKIAKRPGRKMTPGRWAYSQERGFMGIFLGYCDCGCEAKIIKDKREVKAIFQKYCRDRNSLSTLTMKLLLRKRALDTSRQSYP